MKVHNYTYTLKLSAVSQTFLSRGIREVTESSELSSYPRNFDSSKDLGQETLVPFHFTWLSCIRIVPYFAGWLGMIGVIIISNLIQSGISFFSIWLGLSFFPFAVLARICMLGVFF